MAHSSGATATPTRLPGNGGSLERWSRGQARAPRSQTQQQQRLPWGLPGQTSGRAGRAGRGRTRGVGHGGARL